VKHSQPSQVEAIEALQGWWDSQTEDATSFARVPEHLRLTLEAQSAPTQWLCLSTHELKTTDLGSHLHFVGRGERLIFIRGV
jgi:hypothetical protein